MRASQHHRKAASAALSITYLNTTPVRFYNFIGDGKPQSEMVLRTAGFFYPVEAVEDTLFVFIGDTDAVVCDGQVEFIPLSCERQADLTMLGRIADGIVQQDGEHLADPFRVGGTQRKRAVGKLDGQEDIFFLCQRFESFVSVHQQRIQLRRFHADGKAVIIRLGKCEHVIDQRRDAQTLLPDRFQKTFLPFRRRGAAAFRCRQNNGQRRAQFMGR